MPLFESRNGSFVLFIHIPKSAGTYLVKCISDRYLLFSPTKGHLPCSPQHFHKELLVQLGANSISSKSFTVVRSPLQRLISEYRYRVQSNALFRRFLPFDVFARVVIGCYKTNCYILDNHIRPQNEFLLDDTTVFKFEDGMEQVVDWLLNDADVRCKPFDDIVNSSEKRKVMLSKYSYTLVRNFYQRDYDRFCYDSEEPNEYLNIFTGIVFRIYSLFFIFLYKIKRFNS